MVYVASLLEKASGRCSAFLNGHDIKVSRQEHETLPKKKKKQEHETLLKKKKMLEKELALDLISVEN